ncbi:LysR family transcriptional regulator [Cystobacter fuscus]|uniref:LysR family transcriptional regulator n=1 Tax=Cystobacter fuscus TaxID=43 RepID=A0A250JJN5_9BACT|nr:LysR family transcriptional regulator [Cystobacter fuscus]ATB43853.1 LysR family transcriptional regulator [Cystobacter fuscus]
MKNGLHGTGLTELNAVVAVATHKNFRAAASELGLSPSTLSHAIASLEKRLGVRLFHRTTRSVALSDAGEDFLARVKPALASLAEAMESVDAHQKTPTGTLRLNASALVARRILMPLVLEYLRRHPDVRVEVVAEDRPIDIVADGFDAGVRLAGSIPRDMVAIPCSGDVRFIVVGARKYLRARGVPKTPEDLVEHDCIRYRMSNGGIYRWELSRSGEELAVEVKGRLTLDDDGAVVAAALGGAGLAYVSAWNVDDALKTGRLVQVLGEWTPPEPGVCLYYPAHRHASASLRALVALIREWHRPERAETHSGG